MRVASFDNSQDGLVGEHRLIVAAQQGDRAAFAQLVERYWDRLYRWLYHLARDQHTAEDLVQESFLKAFAGIKTFQAGTNFRAWLFRIAHNNYVNQCRATAYRRQALPENLADSQQGPPDQVIHAEMLQNLGRAIQRLPTEFRAALLLRVEEGLSFRQIAEVLDLTEETARWRVFKARQKLLSLLAPPQEQKPEVKGQKSEVRSRKSEDKN
jgi:RNA polymerase sigma-70 factor (ECF subfamily)